MCGRPHNAAPTAAARCATPALVGAIAAVTRSAAATGATAATRVTAATRATAAPRAAESQFSFTAVWTASLQDVTTAAVMPPATPPGGAAAIRVLQTARAPSRGCGRRGREEKRPERKKEQATPPAGALAPARPAIALAHASPQVFPCRCRRVNCSRDSCCATSFSPLSLSSAFSPFSSASSSCPVLKSAIKRGRCGEGSGYKPAWMNWALCRRCSSCTEINCDRNLALSSPLSAASAPGAACAFPSRETAGAVSQSSFLCSGVALVSLTWWVEPTTRTHFAAAVPAAAAGPAAAAVPAAVAVGASPCGTSGALTAAGAAALNACHSCLSLRSAWGCISAALACGLFSSKVFSTAFALRSSTVVASAAAPSMCVFPAGAGFRCVSTTVPSAAALGSTPAAGEGMAREDGEFILWAKQQASSVSNLLPYSQRQVEATQLAEKLLRRVIQQEQQAGRPQQAQFTGPEMKGYRDGEGGDETAEEVRSVFAEVEEKRKAVAWSAEAKKQRVKPTASCTVYGLGRNTLETARGAYGEEEGLWCLYTRSEEFLVDVDFILEHIESFMPPQVLLLLALYSKENLLLLQQSYAIEEHHPQHVNQQHSGILHALGAIARTGEATPDTETPAALLVHNSFPPPSAAILCKEGDAHDAAAALRRGTSTAVAHEKRRKKVCTTSSVDGDMERETIEGSVCGSSVEKRKDETNEVVLNQGHSQKKELLTLVQERHLLLLRQLIRRTQVLLPLLPGKMMGLLEAARVVLKIYTRCSLHPLSAATAAPPSAGATTTPASAAATTAAGTTAPPVPAQVSTAARLSGVAAPSVATTYFDAVASSSREAAARRGAATAIEKAVTTSRLEPENSSLSSLLPSESDQERSSATAAYPFASTINSLSGSSSRKQFSSAFQPAAGKRLAHSPDHLPASSHAAAAADPSTAVPAADTLFQQAHPAAVLSLSRSAVSDCPAAAVVSENTGSPLDYTRKDGAYTTLRSNRERSGTAESSCRARDTRSRGSTSSGNSNTAPESSSTRDRSSTAESGSDRNSSRETITDRDSDNGGTSNTRESSAYEKSSTSSESSKRMIETILYSRRSALLCTCCEFYKDFYVHAASCSCGRRAGAGVDAVSAEEVLHIFAFLVEKRAAESGAAAAAAYPVDQNSLLQSPLAPAAVNKQFLRGSSAATAAYTEAAALRTRLRADPSSEHPAEKHGWTKKSVQQQEAAAYKHLLLCLCNRLAAPHVLETLAPAAFVKLLLLLTALNVKHLPLLSAAAAALLQKWLPPAREECSGCDRDSMGDSSYWTSTNKSWLSSSDGRRKGSRNNRRKEVIESSCSTDGSSSISITSKQASINRSRIAFSARELALLLDSYSRLGGGNFHLLMLSLTDALAAVVERNDPLAGKHAQGQQKHAVQDAGERRYQKRPESEKQDVFSLKEMLMILESCAEANLYARRIIGVLFERLPQLLLQQERGRRQQSMMRPAELGETTAAAGEARVYSQAASRAIAADAAVETGQSAAADTATQAEVEFTVEAAPECQGTESPLKAAEVAKLLRSLARLNVRHRDTLAAVLFHWRRMLLLPTQKSRKSSSGSVCNRHHSTGSGQEETKNCTTFFEHNARSGRRIRENILPSADAVAAAIYNLYRLDVWDEIVVKTSLHQLARIPPHREQQRVVPSIHALLLSLTAIAEDTNIYFFAPDTPV